jgi:predicted N-acetyltransferase YhbS
MGALASIRREQSSSASSSTERLELAPARIGDHLAIHQLLMQVFRGPSTAEFQLQQEEPGYSPANRFVVRDGSRIIGHARVSLREIRFGERWLRAARVFDLCVLPEFRNQRVATHLIAACETLARDKGAALLQTRALRPRLFERQGWFPLGRPSYIQAGPREILAEMERRRFELAALHQASDDLPQLSRTRHPLTVRRWKQTEHAAVQRLYTEATAGMSGPLARSDDYWRWLIARGAYDWFYVVIDGPDRTLFDDIQGHIVGYMFLKGNRIIELMPSPTNDRAADALVARACRDAIEQSVTPLRLDAPLQHCSQELFVAAGGKVFDRDGEGSEVFLAKVLDLARLAEATVNKDHSSRLTIELRSESATIPLHRQSKAASEPQRLILENGQVLADHNPARPQLSCSTAVLVQLLTGHVTLAEACESSQLRTSSRAVRESLEQAILPRPLWFAPLEDLLA